MVDPLITMAEQPSQASCKDSSRLCPAASYRQIVENGQRGIGIAFQRPNRIPRLRPRIQAKVALQVFMPDQDREGKIRWVLSFSGLATQTHRLLAPLQISFGVSRAVSRAAFQ